MNKVLNCLLAALMAFALAWTPVASADYFPANGKIFLKPDLAADGHQVVKIKKLTAVITVNPPAWCGKTPDTDLYGVNVCVIKYGPKTKWVFKNATLYVLPLPGEPFIDAWGNVTNAIGTAKVTGKNVTVHISGAGWGDSTTQWNYVLKLPALSQGVESVWAWGDIPALTNPEAVQWLAEGVWYTRTNLTFLAVSTWGNRKECRWVGYFHDAYGHLRPISHAEERDYVWDMVFNRQICGGFTDK